MLWRFETVALQSHAEQEQKQKQETDEMIDGWMDDEIWGSGEKRWRIGGSKSLPISAR